jgi:hypothetical protein
VREQRRESCKKDEIEMNCSRCGKERVISDITDMLWSRKLNLTHASLSINLILPLPRVVVAKNSE